MDGQPISMFDYEKSFFPIGIIAMDSAKEVGGLIDKHLMGWYYKAKPEAENDENTKKSLLLKLSIDTNLLTDKFFISIYNSFRCILPFLSLYT